MAKHRRFTSHDGATGTGAGSSQKTSGHAQIGLMVHVEGIDPSADSLEVRVEGSADDTHFAQLDSGAPAVEDPLNITEADLTQSDADGTVYVGYIQAHNFPIEYVRANVVTNSAGASVTTYIYLAGWTGHGKTYDNRTDTPTGELGR